MQDTKDTGSDAVLRSWQDNAAPWTDAIREQKIASRTLVTNQAVIDAVVEQHPETVLDLGCGEGWLSWHLAGLGMEVTGTDAIPALVESARRPSSPAKGTPPRFLQLSYEELPGPLAGSRFDLLVCNFSLLDEKGVEVLLAAAPSLLLPGGRLVIQTLHPETLSGEEGWRHESWQGMGGEFRGHAPWYYRTRASWLALFHHSGLQVLNTREPLHPHTGAPASIIFELGVL